MQPALLDENNKKVILPTDIDQNGPPDEGTGNTSILIDGLTPKNLEDSLIMS